MTRSTLAMSLLTGVSLLLRLTNLSFPRTFYFDENYTAYTAVEMAKNNRMELWLPASLPHDPPRGYEWQHPPLTRTLIAASVIILGNKPWVWRLPSVIAGTLTIPLIFLIGKRYFSTKVGLLAAFFLAFDGLSLAQSRIATRDALLVFFILLSLLLMLRKNAILSAITAGLALATKWSALPLLPLLLANSVRFNKTHTSRATLVLLLTVLPTTVYGLTYIPYFSTGFNHIDFMDLHQAIVQHMSVHAFTLEKLHPFHSPWWKWLFGFEPIAHYLDGVHQIWAMPNFFAFWLGASAMGMSILALTRKKPNTNRRKQKAQSTVLAGYLAFLLPWIAIFFLKNNSSASYLHYYLPSLSFLHILSAFWIAKFLKGKHRTESTFAQAVLASTILLFIAIYPRLVGL